MPGSSGSTSSATRTNPICTTRGRVPRSACSRRDPQPGFAAAEAPTAKIGSAPENDIVPESTAMRSIAGAPESVVTAQTVGGGGGGCPRCQHRWTGDESAAVSSAPVTRSIVIRRSPQTASSDTRVRAAYTAVALCSGVGGAAPRIPWSLRPANDPGGRLPRHRRHLSRKAHWRRVIQVPRGSPTPIVPGMRSTSDQPTPATFSSRRCRA